MQALLPGYNQAMLEEMETIRKKLARVLWLGGSPCSGKSSIADALAEQYNLRLYRCDEAFFRHDKQTTPERQPVFYRVMRLSCEALWMRPVAQQAAEEIEIYREEFPMILQDLLQLLDDPDDDRSILAEGAALLPELVAPLMRDGSAFWVVPSAEFQRDHYARREWTGQVLKDCQDPQQAFQNWMERDICFARFVRREAARLGLPVLVVDGAASIVENTALVEKFFRLGPNS